MNINISTLVLFILFIFGNASMLFAQLEGRYWYFGQKAGIRFDAGGPVKLEDGQMNTGEGCSVASMPTGELLFYSDGISVWNKNHEVMPNGFGLLGNSSSTQSGVILPKPDEPGRYFLFTVAAEDYIDPGLRYSEIDMNLNGGLGDVISQTKNTSLQANCTEKLCALTKSDNSGYWVLSHNRLGNEFYAFNVSANGVNSTPVVSAIGENYLANDLGYSLYSFGHLKFSPNGKWVAASYSIIGNLEFFTFDSNSGKVSESLCLEEWTQDIEPYGLEFSPNSQLLYTSLCNYANLSCQYYQYDLTTGNGEQIKNSKLLIGTILGTNLQYFGWNALQIGLDNRIYFTNFERPNLGAIPSPNQPGIGCGFIENAVDLGTRVCEMGLPTTIQSVYSPCVNTHLRFFTLFKKSFVCTECTNGKIAATGIGGVKPYQYSLDNENFQDSGVFNNLTPGLYTIFIKDAAGCIVRRKIILGN